MPSVSTLKMAACLRSQEEPDAIFWAEVAWREDDDTRAAQWIGYVQGNPCTGITWDEGNGYLVHIHQQYVGHAATAQEAIEETAAILAEQSGFACDVAVWLAKAAWIMSLPEVKGEYVARQFMKRELRVAFGK
jgi:hypothetical protein